MRHALALTALVAFLTPMQALAECGTGNPISYDDISNVLLTDDYRISDGNRDKYGPAASLGESTFWLHFMDLGGGESATVYSQYTLSGSVGTFRLQTILADAKAILEQDHFYDLSPPAETLPKTMPVTVPEKTTLSILTVLRCAVVTRIIMANDPAHQEPATAKLFADFDALIARSPKTKVDTTPMTFPMADIFDP